MTATERLRALLDKCGVEWRPIAWNPKKETFYYTSEGVGFCADEYVDGVKIYTDAIIAPEQAIAATLGPGTCRMEHLWSDDIDGVCWWCKACDKPAFTHGDFQPNYCPNCGRKVVE